jgi:hypothetical protein
MNAEHKAQLEAVIRDGNADVAALAQIVLDLHTEDEDEPVKPAPRKK